MSLNRLFATGFRNLTNTQFEPTSGINLLFGENGSGKTSLLEAAYFLSSARSFRTTMQDPVIQRNSEECLVRGELNNGGQRWQVGVSRNRSGQRDIRVNGEKCAKASELAQLLPTLLLGPESVDLLIGPPDGRRKFLNWGLFHVEQSAFVQLWEESNRCLRQRNRILRDGVFDQDELRTWSVQLAQQAEKLDSERKKYIETFRPVFHSVVAKLSDFESVDVQYHRGWEEGSNLLEIYEKEAEIDQKRGYTQKGFQRADVRITVSGQPAVKVCSRGELKALVWSLILAQGALNDTRDTLYLIDDLASEFDVEHRRRVGAYLAETGQQVLLTGVEQQALKASCEGAYSGMFHVEHGKVTSG